MANVVQKKQQTNKQNLEMANRITEKFLKDFNLNLFLFNLVHIMWIFTPGM